MRSKRANRHILSLFRRGGLRRVLAALERVGLDRNDVRDGLASIGIGRHGDANGAWQLAARTALERGTSTEDELDILAVRGLWRRLGPETTSPRQSP